MEFDLAKILCISSFVASNNNDFHLELGSFCHPRSDSWSWSFSIRLFNYLIDNEFEVGFNHARWRSEDCAKAFSIIEA
ncbi:hypothetical protein DEO72_LG2g3438 [Vigna unguiculata]|uniref:Uncharacterized protein n=1 Tax=Vigna unguiculata TaxID=3917 RepID=A0A4D6L3Q3_VIGUN|nr:hypothetical protein DEO72_LG2g3438 [Vigna unguiculata]